MLANWGQQYPAIISTPKGALLNWPLGQRLSKTTVVMALSRVMPMAKPDSIVFAESFPNQPFKQLANKALGALKTNVTQAPVIKNSPKDVLSPDYSFNQAILENKPPPSQKSNSLRPPAVTVTVAEKPVDITVSKPTVPIPPKTPTVQPPQAKQAQAVPVKPPQVKQAQAAPVEPPQVKQAQSASV